MLNRFSFPKFGVPNTKPDRMSNVTPLFDLWNNTRNGDHKSYALLHQSLYPGLFVYAVKMIKDADLADDLLQDLFVKFWQKRSHIGVITNVKSYFYRAARSMVLNHIKSDLLKEARLDAMPEPDLEFSTEELILSQESNTELKRTLTNALNQLPAKQREAIHLRFYENMEYNQIAELTGTKYQSVINNVYRGIQVLREAWSLSSVSAAS